MDFQIDKSTEIDKHDFEDTFGIELSDTEWKLIINHIKGSNNGFLYSQLIKDIQTLMYKYTKDVFDNIFYETTIRKVKEGV